MKNPEITANKVSFARLVGKNGIIIAFILIFILLSVTTDSFLKLNNIMTILRQSSIIGIVSLGMAAVIISNNIDLSVGPNLAISGIVAALAMTSWGLPIWIACALGILTGVCVGLINGTVIAKGKIPPFIVTLGMMTSLRGLCMIVANGTPIGGLPKSFAVLGGGSFIGLPVPVLIYAVAIAGVTILMRKTRFGRHTYAVGGNEQAALFSGINVTRLKIKVYILMGFLCGVSGIVLASRIKSGQPNVAQGYELDAIAACIIGGISFNGGVGKVWNAVLGTLMIGILNNGLDLLAVQSYYQQILKGIIIVAAVLIDRKRTV